MADPYRRKRRDERTGERVPYGPWRIKWREANGRWKTEVTRARSKEEARELVRAEEMRVERQKRGLEPIPSDCRWSLRRLRNWWLENRCPKPSHDIAKCQLEKHTKPIEELKLSEVTSETLEMRFAEMMVSGASAATINKVRGYLRSMFQQAKKSPARWTRNPAAETEVRKISKRHYELLTVAQMQTVLQKIPAPWLNFIAAGVFTAMRKGEICGARKEFVNLEHRTLLVAASHKRTTTKSGRWRTIPISSHFLPFVEAALKTRGPWLFPDAEGNQRTKESDPHLVLRKALAKIGIDRKVRLHDLRHSIATELIRRGHSLAKVQQYLGHEKLSTTVDLYGHLLTEDLRETAELLGAPVVPTPPTLPPIGALETADSPLNGPYPVRTDDPYRVKVNEVKAGVGTESPGEAATGSYVGATGRAKHQLAGSGRSDGAPVVPGETAP